MVDANIKKLRILKSSLPPIDHDTLNYNLRYRIISDDRNRKSHYSPVYNISEGSITSVSGALSITTTIINAVWGDANLRPKYDIFVGFDGAAPTYHGTSSVHSYSFLNTGSSSVRVKIQISSSKKEVKAGLNIFDSGTESLV